MIVARYSGSGYSEWSKRCGFRCRDIDENSVEYAYSIGDAKGAAGATYVPTLMNEHGQPVPLVGRLQYALGRVLVYEPLKNVLGLSRVRVAYTAGEAIGPDLRDRGLIFVGIDVIGDYLTEINVTSPTGIREVKRFGGADIAALIWDAIERRR